MLNKFNQHVRFLILTLFVVTLSTSFTTLLAQVPVDSLAHVKAVGKDTYSSLQNFIGGIEWIYGFLVIVTGYLSNYIPLFKSIDKGVYRVLALAAVLGAGFFFGAGTSLINLFITYTVSTSFYEVILKLLKKGPIEKAS